MHISHFSFRIDLLLILLLVLKFQNEQQNNNVIFEFLVKFHLCGEVVSPETETSGEKHKPKRKISQNVHFHCKSRFLGRLVLVLTRH